ncbi:MAG: transposase [Gemmataceae bacterium]|nr:transposase [Gemmataceae bacterium]
MATWVTEEIRGVDLKDTRLNKRPEKVLSDLGDRPTLSIPAACGGHNEMTAAYRFFDTDNVTFDRPLAPHRACTLRRAQDEDVSVDDRDPVPDAGVGLPGRGAPVPNGEAGRRLSGGLPDRGVADVVRPPAGSELPGPGLRGRVRAGGMEIGLDGRASGATAAEAPATRGHGPPDRPAGWVCESPRPRGSARPANGVDRAPAEARSRLGMGRFRPRCSQTRCVEQRGLTAWAGNATRAGGTFLQPLSPPRAVPWAMRSHPFRLKSWTPIPCGIRQSTQRGEGLNRSTRHGSLFTPARLKCSPSRPSFFPLCPL